MTSPSLDTRTADTPGALRARELIERTVRRRATHETRDDVGDTRSYANMERTLKREYWGRFLIELLQNARDAWNLGHPDATDGVVLVRLTNEPALIVANQGDALRPEVLLDSISKFGESTKEFGAAIGHKGIGFKAVLEISLAPEIHSRAAADGPFDVRVRFDPDDARRLIHEMTPNWDALVRELVSADSTADPDERIPVLRFPTWIAEPGAWLGDTARWQQHTFNTIIKLPFDVRHVRALDLDEAAFVERVRQAIAELSDEIVLLLRSFGTVVIENEITGHSEVIRREELPALEPATGASSPAERYSIVRITRNGAETSRWLLADERLAGASGLDEEVAVAIRLTRPDAEGAGPASIAPPSSDPAGPPFHLFFPTRIPSHLPFLLHAYFQVDAGRKAFAEDEAARNERLLGALRESVVRVVRHLGALHDTGHLDISPLADLMAATAGDADDPLARAFRDALLAELDDVPFVPTLDGAGLAPPSRILADPRGDLSRLLPSAFPPEHLSTRTGLRYADGVGWQGLAFLAERGRVARGTDHPGLDAASLAGLLRPGDRPIWPAEIDAGFGALLQVLDYLRVEDAGAREVIAATVGDDTAKFIPVSHTDPPFRRLRAPLLAGGGVIMAPLRGTDDSALVPPEGLGIDFLGERALDRGLLTGVAVDLGIREYSTDAILDAVASRGQLADPGALLTFLWRLLLRERLSGYSVPAALDAAQMFDPGRFFWATRGRGSAEIDRARRERALDSVRLPARSGRWRPAADMCFGSDWADWIESLVGAEVGAASSHRRPRTGTWSASHPARMTSWARPT